MKRVNVLVEASGLLLLGGALFSASLIELSEQPAPAAPQETFHFNKDVPGKPPKGFTTNVTGSGSKVRWIVQKVSHPSSPPNILAPAGQAEPGRGSALIVADDVLLEDGDISVKFKVVGDTEDQSLGIVYRYQSPTLYHVAEVDAKEIACHLYRFKNGKKKSLDSQSVIVTPGIWHTLRVIFRKSHYSLYVDGALAMAGKAKTALRPGRVGLWIAGDTAAQFDDLSLAP